MRLWSLHPCYLDARGLVAAWREALLARAVLQHRTRGYRSHPQLERFRAQRNPVACVNSYLLGLYEEATRRGYRFNRAKLARVRSTTRIAVTTGQLEHERRHLLSKLRRRDRAGYRAFSIVQRPRPHPLFRTTRGGIAPWERPAKR